MGSIYLNSAMEDFKSASLPALVTSLVLDPEGLLGQSALRWNLDPQS